MKHSFIKAAAMTSLAIVSLPSKATDCPGWLMASSCQAVVGAAPSNSIWNPVLGSDSKIGITGAANFGLATYGAIVWRHLFGNDTSEEKMDDYGPGIGSVSTSPQAMYKRVDVYDVDCQCTKSLLKRIQ